jgi:hypothetical protein
MKFTCVSVSVSTESLNQLVVKVTVLFSKSIVQVGVYIHVVAYHTLFHRWLFEPS